MSKMDEYETLKWRIAEHVKLIDKLQTGASPRVRTKLLKSLIRDEVKES